jgi:hypothetical protein
MALPNSTPNPTVPVLNTHDNAYIAFASGSGKDSDPFTGLVVSTQSGGLPATGGSYTDASVSSATGSSQTLVDTATAKAEVNIVNISSNDWWINPTGGAAAVSTAGSFPLHPGDSVTLFTNGKVTGIGTSTAALTVFYR